MRIGHRVALTDYWSAGNGVARQLLALFHGAGGWSNGFTSSRNDMKMISSMKCMSSAPSVSSSMVSSSNCRTFTLIADERRSRRRFLLRRHDIAGGLAVLDIGKIVMARGR